MLNAAAAGTDAAERSVAGKRVISFGWDTPSAVLLSEKASAIEATGLDGVALTFVDRRKNPQGKLEKRDMRFWWVHSRPVKRADIQRGIDALQGKDLGRLKHNFLTMYASTSDAGASPEQFFVWDGKQYDTSRYKPFWPGRAGTSQAWPEDPRQYLNAFKQNMVLAARICRELGLAGFLIDQETYNRGQMDETWPMEVFDEPVETIRARARRNVAEVFQAVCEEFPEIQIMLIPGGRYKTQHDHADSLCMAFTDGILMGLGPQASLHDGQEKAYDMSRHRRFVALKQKTREMGLQCSAVPELYRSRMKYSFGIWLDHRSASYGGWYKDPHLNHFTARTFGDALYNALYESDGYVWVYNEKAIMWGGDWRSHKQPNVNEAYLEAIRNCKKSRPLDRAPDSRGAENDPLPQPAASIKTKGDSLETAAPGMELVMEIKDGWEIWFDAEDIGLWSQGLRYPPDMDMSFWYTRIDPIDWQPVQVGEFWERQGHRYNGTAWYRVRFKVPEKYRGRELYFIIGGAANKCSVYLNQWEWIYGVYKDTGMAVGAGPMKARATGLKFGDQENFLGLHVMNHRGPGGVYKPVWLAAETKESKQLSIKPAAPEGPNWFERFNYTAGDVLDVQSPKWSGNGAIVVVRNHWSGQGACRNTEDQRWGSAFRATEFSRVTAALYSGDVGGIAAMGLGDTNTAADGALTGNGQVAIRLEYVNEEANVRLVPQGGWEGAVTGVDGLTLDIYEVRITLTGEPGGYTGTAQYRDRTDDGDNPWISMGSGPVHKDVEASHVCIGLYKKGRLDNVRVSAVE